jgi:hypothetical protein
MTQILRSGVSFQCGIAAAELSFDYLSLGFEGSINELNQRQLDKRSCMRIVPAHLLHLFFDFIVMVFHSG